MKYKIEHRIKTLAKNAVKPTCSSFELDDIKYSQWDFNMRDGWRGEDAWLAKGEVEAEDFTKAVNIFVGKLLSTTRHISFITQSYTEAWSQPWLGIREDLNIGFFRYIKEIPGGGLMFNEEDLAALNLLRQNKTIPEEFYYYWSDAQMTFGYVGKLMLMFSALEALVKTSSKTNDYVKMELILGKKLKETLFGVKGDSHGGLRHRLVHGEYLSSPDAATNYLELIHRAVLTYFNQEILKQNLLNLNVVNPQRHFFGNREECRLYLEPKGDSILNLKNVLSEFDEKGIHHYDNYYAVWDKKRQEEFVGTSFPA